MHSVSLFLPAPLHHIPARVGEPKVCTLSGSAAPLTHCPRRHVGWLLATATECQAPLEVMAAKARVAIVGAGFGGMTACKAAVERNFKPTVFEASHKAGGLWKEGSGIVWHGMHTNISFHAMTFSDYPREGQQTLFATEAEVGLAKWAGQCNKRWFEEPGSGARVGELWGAVKGGDVTLGCG